MSKKVGVFRSKPSEPGAGSRGAYVCTRARPTPGSRRDRPKDTGLLARGPGERSPADHVAVEMQDTLTRTRTFVNH